MKQLIKRIKDKFPHELINNKLMICGNCLDVMKDMEDNSIDSIVCDPPYFLIDNYGSGFMMKEWDGTKNLWKYLWQNKKFVNIVENLLMSLKVEKNMEEEFIVQKNVNIKELEKEKKENAQFVKSNLKFCDVLKKDSVHLLAVTKRDLLDLLKEPLGNHIKQDIFLNGEKESALFVIPIILQKKELKNIVVKNVIKSFKAKECKEKEISFTKMEIQKIKDVIVEMTGGLLESPFTKETNGLADFVENTVEGKKYNATILFPLKKEEVIKNLTLLLYATFVTRKWKGIQKDLIKNFFRTIFQEVTRVLKPGGYLLAFGGTRSYHLLADSIEDSGLQCKDTLVYCYGSGFPKSLNIEKSLKKKGYIEKAKEFAGFGTALKPAMEMICLAKKPISEKNIASNVLKYGTGGINIDGCRVGDSGARFNGRNVDSNIYGKYGVAKKKEIYNKGRFPANIIHDGSEEVMKVFPCSNGGKIKHNSEIKREGMKEDNPAFNSKNCGFDVNKCQGLGNYGDKGSASRFFYCAKASKEDRNEGLDNTRLVKYNIPKDKFKKDKLCKDVSTALVESLKKATSELTAIWLTGECGENITGLCQQGSLSITLMEINKITELKIWNLLRHSIIKEYIVDVNYEMVNGGSLAEIVGNLKKLKPTITNERAELVLGVKNVASQMLSSIKKEENWNVLNNFHSTVKPTKLMQYLVRLVTPPKGIVLDPFMGSGSTGKACIKEQFGFIGIDLNDEYYNIACRRVREEAKQGLFNFK